MNRLLPVLILLITANFTNSIFAQKDSKTPCSGEKYSQFDFWEGNWNVYNTSGKLIGINKLVKKQSNCVMQENWVSKTGSNKGTSYNYYNKTDDTWNQVWVNNTGFSLVLKGKLNNGKMILKSNKIKIQIKKIGIILVV